METEFLTVRLTTDDARVIEKLREKTGLSKSDIVKRALRSLAQADSNKVEGGLFALGATRFGRHGNVSRQSSNIKQIVKARARAKRTG